MTSYVVGTLQLKKLQNKILSHEALILAVSWSHLCKHAVYTQHFRDRSSHHHEGLDLLSTDFR